MAAARGILNYLRSHGHAPLTRDAIADALKLARVPRETPECLNTAELAKMLEACLRHDREVHVETRVEHRGEQPKGTTPKYAPIAPLVLTTLLCGFRINEALTLRWEAVALDTVDADGNPAGEIVLKAAEVKTARGRKVMLDVSPSVPKLFAAMRMRSSRSAIYAFGGNEGKKPMAKSLAESSRRRLIAKYGAPVFSWGTLRSTCASYGSSVTGIWGESAAFSSAKRLGHDIVVADRHYTNVVSVPREARTLEAAMQIEEQAVTVVARVRRANAPERRSLVLVNAD